MAGKGKQSILSLRYRAVISLFAAIFVFALTLSGAFGTLNEQLSQWVYQKESVTTLPVVIVEIDERTLAEYGQPSEWSRQMYADLLDRLNASPRRPSVIAFDIMFTGYKSDRDGDMAFAAAAAKYGNVVAGINIDSVEQGSGAEALTFENLYRSAVSFPYEELRACVDYGIVNCAPDRYNYVTRAYTGARIDGKWYDAFPVTVLNKFFSYVKTHPEYAAYHPEYSNVSVRDFSKEARNLYRFSYTAGPADFECHSMADILNGSVSGEHLDGSIVLVGATAAGLGDDYKILFRNSSNSSLMAGVKIHANILEAVFHDRFQTDAPRLLMAVIYAVVSGLLCFLMLRFGILAGLLLSLGAAVLHIISGLLLYKNGIFVGLLPMLLACVLLAIGTVVRHYLSARNERQKINKAFRMYVAPEIVDEVASSGTYEMQLGGRHKDIAVLFIDIRGFTTMSENLDPEEVVNILNEYFGVITDAIFKNKGTLDKFIGDAAMAVFNSPFDLDDYVYRAVMTACDIAKASETLSSKLMERFGKTVSFGIGVNCGEAIIGNIGSSFRMDYTAIGDTVNTASRLESNAKAGEILISEEVKNRLDGRIETEPVGEIPLKGKSHKIFVYRVKL